MEPVTLRAHFDGKQILLDEPFELEPNTEVIVTVLPRAFDEEREDWTRLAVESLARARACFAKQLPGPIVSHPTSEKPF